MPGSSTFSMLALYMRQETPGGKASIPALPGLMLHSSLRAAPRAQATTTSAVWCGSGAPAEVSHTFTQQHEWLPSSALRYTHIHSKVLLLPNYWRKLKSAR